MSDSLWTGVGARIDRCPSLEDLGEQGLHLLAADRWRARGVEVPQILVFAELDAVQRLADAKEALRQCQAAFDGRFVVLKGPELAGHYPRAEWRSFGDLDLLSDQPERLQEALVAAGFEPEASRGPGYFQGLHHLQPLRAPGPSSLLVEVHRHPSWVRWNDPPPFAALYEGNVSSAIEVPGLRALAPAAHAVLVAVHGWAESPLRRLADLVDVAALLEGASRDEAAAYARAWHVPQLWATTVRAIDALLLQRGESLAVRTWGRNLIDARRRTVLENHLRSWLSPLWARPPGPALAESALAVWHDLTPGESEGWRSKLHRVGQAVRNPSRPNDEHERLLGPEAIQPRFKRR